MLSRNLTDISRSLVTLTKPGYKMTEIGEIPVNCELHKFSEIAETVKGSAPKNLPATGEELKLYPYLSADYLRGNAEKTQYFKISNRKTNKIVNEDEIILIWDGSNAGEFFIGNEGLLSSTMVKLVFKTFDVVPRFTYYYMKKEENKLKKTVKGSTIPHVNGDSLLNLYILLPPVPEQQKIAEILSTADETIRKVNEEITLTKKLKKGLMQTLLTKGIGHTKFKITEIGEIPEEWPLRPFSEVLQIRKRKNEGKSEKIYTIPMELIPQNETYCGYRSLNKSEVVPPTYCECGDILLPKITPSVENGKQGIVPTMPSGNAFATSEVYALFTNGSLTNIYTFYLLKLSLFRKPLIDSMVGTTGRQRVPKDSLFNLSFPVPPIPEQQKISEILTTIDHKLELLRSKKTHLEELKKGMMEELLTGRVRVKV